MRKIISKNLATATFIVCTLYIAIFVFSRVDSIQKQNNGKLSGQANAAYECASGYIEVADFCIQSETAGDENWHDAALACAQDEEARLCKAQELMAACQAEHQDGTSFDDNIDGGGWEWADDIDNRNEATVMFRNNNNCKAMNKRNLSGSSNDFRCCKNRY
ncbi:hypothetical protein HN784_04990 [bacterium]|jgi:hypothetical protein|nr:hypothetical protein [bacterium]MBT4250748.1 hypothetical protein [bacterium]MBT4598169.1 hypothetical protein [bacterium]MBT6753767.1 hypothetical protein [bacterium]MBT7037520.1 hypothetical protein [bacterium]